MREQERLQAHSQRMCAAMRCGAEMKTTSSASPGCEDLIGTQQRQLLGLVTLRALADEHPRMELANTRPSHRPELADVGQRVLCQALRTDREPMHTAAQGPRQLE